MLNRKYIATVLIIGWLAIGCQRTNDGTALPQGTVLVGNKRTARIGQDVTITADTIMDSRCPKDVQCVWAGNARVAFTLSNNVISQKDTLCIGDCRAPSKGNVDTILIGNTRYKVTLLDVTPYPVANTTTKPEALLKVEQL